MFKNIVYLIVLLYFIMTAMLLFNCLFSSTNKLAMFSFFFSGIKTFISCTFCKASKLNLIFDNCATKLSTSKSWARKCELSKLNVPKSKTANSLLDTISLASVFSFSLTSLSCENSLEFWSVFFSSDSLRFRFISSKFLSINSSSFFWEIRSRRAFSFWLILKSLSDGLLRLA
eukprot:NODE_29_length_33183_cov_0.333666.p19 type:complete len:173 gc:universal NODE_29_length_33183_cov_0.333666:7827-8345(+)